MRYILVFALLSLQVIARPVDDSHSTERVYVTASVPAVVRVVSPLEDGIRASLCTGFVVKPGYIVTAKHCIHDYARPSMIGFQNGKELPFQPLKLASDEDIVILKGDTQGIKPLRAAPSDKFPSMALGIRGIEQLQMAFPCSPIMIDREIPESPVLAMLCAARHGDSGGPVIAYEGYVGVVIAFNVEAPYLSYAVPSSYVEALLKDLK